MITRPMVHASNVFEDPYPFERPSVMVVRAPLRLKSLKSLLGLFDLLRGEIIDHGPNGCGQTDSYQAIEVGAKKHGLKDVAYQEELQGDEHTTSQHYASLVKIFPITHASTSILTSVDEAKVRSL